MLRGLPFKIAVIAALAALISMAGQANAAQCGNGPAGFETWKTAFAAEAKAKGIGGTALDALMATHYNHATIGADRGQGGFHVSLEQFMARRAVGIAGRGRALKQ